MVTLPWEDIAFSLLLLLYIQGILFPKLALSGSDMKMLVAWSCLTLCDPLDCSPPGSSVHGVP